MKLAVAALIAGMFGAMIGYEFAGHVFFPKLSAELGRRVHSIASEQRAAAIVSLMALTKLEMGDIEETKSLLAHEVMDYSRNGFDASLPPSDQLPSVIQEAIEKSPALKQESAKDQ